jgi:hypothetical protein
MIPKPRYGTASIKAFDSCEPSTKLRSFAISSVTLALGVEYK